MLGMRQGKRVISTEGGLQVSSPDLVRQRWSPGGRSLQSGNLRLGWDGVGSGGKMEWRNPLIASEKTLLHRELGVGGRLHVLRNKTGRGLPENQEP